MVAKVWWSQHAAIAVKVVGEAWWPSGGGHGLAGLQNFQGGGRGVLVVSFARKNESHSFATLTV